PPAPTPPPPPPAQPRPRRAPPRPATDQRRHAAAEVIAAILIEDETIDREQFERLPQSGPGETAPARTPARAGYSGPDGARAQDAAGRGMGGAAPAIRPCRIRRPAGRPQAARNEGV